MTLIESIMEGFDEELIEMSPLKGRDMNNRPPLYDLEYDKINEIKSFLLHSLSRVAHEAVRNNKQLEDVAEMLWVVLANVSEGDWSKQTKEWQEAAVRWRDNYFSAITQSQLQGRKFIEQFEEKI